MKAAAITLVALLMLSGRHVTLWFAGGWRAVPVPVLAAVVICSALTALIYLIVCTGIRDGLRLWRSVAP